MKINPKQLLRDYAGEVIKISNDELTLGDAILVAINYNDKDKKVDPAQSMKIYKSSLAIAQAKGEIDIDIDLAKSVKDNIVQVYGPLIAGQVISILEG